MACLLTVFLLTAAMPLSKWIDHHEILLAWLGGLSLLMFLGSLFAIPILIAYLPSDFLERTLHSNLPQTKWRRVGHLLKNLLGIIFFLAGILMLILPGQGILAMIVGLSLIDFPGKHHLQLRLLGIRRVRLTIAWIRRKAGQKPLVIPD